MPDLDNIYGLGSVSPRKRAGGRVRYLARVPNGTGGHAVLGNFDSEEEAWSALRGAAEARAKGELRVSGETLRTFGVAFLARRESNGGRNATTDASRWKRHILTAPFADWPLPSIAPKHVAAWIDKLVMRRAADRRGRRPISPQTVRHAVALLRRALQVALTRGLVSINAAAGHDLPSVSKDDVWTYLTPEEQERLCSCDAIPVHDRLAIAFAIGSGLRQGEQWALELRDVHVDGVDPYVVVRWGGFKKSKRQPPKNGKVRTVPLFGIALEAAREWLAILPGFAPRNPAGIMWPTARGCRRREGKPPRGWSKATRKGAKSYLEAAGLGDVKARHDRRPVRWHDLRHTCAASLVSGFWGRRWSLIEVRDQLGHTSIDVTQRYAHLAPGVLAEAARETGATPKRDTSETIVETAAVVAEHGRGMDASAIGGTWIGVETPWFLGARHTGFEPVAFGSGGPTPIAIHGLERADLDRRVQVRVHVRASGLAERAQAALDAAADGHPHAVRLLINVAIEARNLARSNGAPLPSVTRPRRAGGAA